MPRRVPVLRQDHGVEICHQGVDAGHNLISARHGKRATGAEVILYVDNDKGFHAVSFAMVL